ncbi:heparan-alpha-glucosaminide N-acetyltransferase isoform X2 [Anoplolepis gracilipes]|uniref:heparan-alpha-glucosaminide N-acetyltransferase isoform X2 n=1 Tax=Anoplolepis gracilipes TaxID=354296 RepID=UPI003BA385A5
MEARKFSCFYEPLKFDEACVNVISNNNNYSMWLYSLSMDCLSCPYKRIAWISTNGNYSSLKFSTIQTVKWRVLKNNGNDEYISAKNTNDIFCELSPNLGQYGLYELTVQNKTCSCKTLRNPTYPYSGVALNTLGTDAQLENIRIFGVLQRFGITYLIVGLVYLCFTSQQSKAAQNLSQTWIIHKMRDVLSLLPHWCVMLTLVKVHCALTFALPIPGCPTGYLGPGGRHADGKYFNCTGGAAGYIDRILLTPSHIYQGPTIDSIYGSGPFDPEGILGCLTSTFQVFLGVHTGIILMMYRDWKERVIRWLLWAVFYGCLGCAFHFTNLIPINKNLWSLSFVLVSTCFALVFLSGCYLLIDVARIWRGGPFRIPGMNALALYVGHSMCYQIFPFHWKIGAMDNRALCLTESIWVVTLWTVIAYVMHRKRIYITL